MALTILHLVATVILLASSTTAVCPAFPSECRCDEIEDTYTIYCRPTSVRPLKSLMQEIEEEVNVADRGMFQKLTISFLGYSDSALTMIPPKTIEKLRFREIEVYNGKNLYFDPQAFQSTYSHALQLTFSSVTFDDNRDSFPFLKKFTNLKKISFTGLNSDSRLEALPALAFSGMNELESVYVDDMSLSTIGDSAFKGLQKLKYISLQENQLSLERIHEGAFKGIGPNSVLNITSNWFLTRLSEAKFGDFLSDTNNNTLQVGPLVDLEVLNHLICDKEAHWICDKSEEYKTRIIGYYCDGSQEDIFEYCTRIKNGAQGNSITIGLLSLLLVFGIVRNLVL